MRELLIIMDNRQLSGKTKVCKICDKEKPIEEFISQKTICKVCNYLNKHNNLDIKNGWTINEYKIILDNLLNSKVKYINDLEFLLDNKKLNNIIDICIFLKINGGYHGNRKIIILTNCKQCGKQIEMNLSKYSHAKNHFCSDICQNKWKSENIRGNNHPNYSKVIVKCDWCGKKILKNPFDIERSENHFCNNKCKREYFANVTVKTDKWIEQNRQVALTNLENGAYSHTNTEAQQKINILLDKLGIRYTNEKVFDYYAVDNYLNDYNLIIEVQGDYWHTNPLVYNKICYQNQLDRIYTDKNKKKYLNNKYNMHILYLWENDINNNIELCKLLIQKYIKNEGILANYHSFNYSIDNSNLYINKKLIKPYYERSKNFIHNKTDLSIKYKPEYYITFRCDNCGKEVRRLKSKYNAVSNHHFCSKKCSSEFLVQDKISVKCDNCGKEFKLLKRIYEKSKLHFCSNMCRKIYQKNNVVSEVVVKCSHCGKKFEVKQFKYNNNKSKNFYCCKECYEKDRKVNIIKFQLSIVEIFVKELSHNIIKVNIIFVVIVVQLLIETSIEVIK